MSAQTQWESSEGGIDFARILLSSLDSGRKLSLLLLRI